MVRIRFGGDDEITFGEVYNHIAAMIDRNPAVFDEATEKYQLEPDVEAFAAEIFTSIEAGRYGVIRYEDGTIARLVRIGRSNDAGHRIFPMREVLDAG